MRRTQNGFTLIEVMIVVLVLGIIGVIGWRVYDANVNKPVANQANTPTQMTTRIQSTSDLDKAAQTLDNTDVAGDYDSQLNAQTNF